MGIHLMSQTCLPGERKGETPFGFRLNFWGRGYRRGTGLGSSRASGPERLGSGNLWPGSHLCCPLGPMVATADPLGSQLGKMGLRASS